jgi:5-methylcytosine-specific restriction endonuclease McrA
MKDEILKLRAEGLSYNQISEKLNCSKGIISYHCGGENQKAKSREKNQARRKNLVILKKVENFQVDRKIRDKSEDFQRERVNNKLGKRNLVFRWQDVIEKFGWETICYLTGKPINLREPKTYQFDHIIPYGKGGSSTLDNLGILCKEVNQAKADMTVENFLNLCKEILEYNGYKVTKESLGMWQAPLS